MISNVAGVLNAWSEPAQLGEAVPILGIIFDDAGNVTPDVVWISQERLAVGLDDEGHLTIAPELIVEVLSPFSKNEQRDRETKVKLHTERATERDVQEYWILDWRTWQLDVYRRQDAMLVLVATLFEGDRPSPPLLTEFNCIVSQFFR